MLTNHKVLEGKLFASWLETSKRENGESTRFKFVVDETDDVLAAVTSRYTLVQNRELVSALDMAASERNLDITPTRANYKNGHSMYKFQMPGMEFTAPGDPSVTKAGIILQNDYRGNGGLVIGAGLYRKACTNDLTIGRVAHVDTMRHVGKIDVYAFVSNALDALVSEFEVNRLLAETLANTPYRVATLPGSREAAQKEVKAALDANRVAELVTAILADTADRYHGALRTAIREDARDMGDNLWAVVQSVARVATHDMPAIEAATTWATRQANRVREFANV